MVDRVDLVVVEEVHLLKLVVLEINMAQHHLRTQDLHQDKEIMVVMDHPTEQLDTEVAVAVPAVLVLM
tara:strand:+ start:157 stop:360 length:204 start_codon:yes stop_codon:yes gene_type:complete